MNGKPRIYKRSKRGFRCRRCGAKAEYQRRDGTRAGDAQHDLCWTCFKAASKSAEGMGKRYLKEHPIEQQPSKEPQ